MAGQSSNNERQRMLEAMTHAMISFSKGYVVDDQVVCLTISDFEVRILLLAQPLLSPQSLNSQRVRD